MKRYSLPLFLMLVTLVVTGCTYDPAFEGLEEVSVDYRGDPVDAFLDITVGELSVSMETRAEDEGDPYEDTEAERWVNDIWVFQYNASTHKAIDDPQHVIIEDQEMLQNIPVTLSDNEGDQSLIYVVANASSEETWGNNFETVELLLAAAIHSHEPIIVTKSTEVGDLSIPMEGNSEAVQVVANMVVKVPVTRMFAKIMIDPYLELSNSEIYSVGVGNIPLYCQVGSLYSGDDAKPADYPSDVQWISRSFSESLVDEDQSGSGTTTDYGYRYIMYVPENLAGQEGDRNTPKLDQESVAPTHALQVNIVITHTDSEGGDLHYPYTVYPGADVYTDYNIKRNNVYRVKVNISTLSMARVPSANCFVALEGEEISFYPYYRVETGGGYDFTDYLDPDGAEDAQTDKGAKIDHVGIVWQTKECIGDNTNGDLVWISPNNATHTGFEQIYVKTNKEGNALIAAYDKVGNIIWSWHIWVRTAANGDPTHPAAALVYYTYSWDASGINGIYQNGGNDVARVPGYEIMACNLGALQDKPNWTSCSHLGDFTSSSSSPQTFDNGDGIVRTFGMLYQWGRKDPFPPMTETRGEIGNTNGINTGFYVHNYDDDHTETLYGNDNNTEVHKTSYEISDYLFHTHTHTTSDVITGMRYSIAHPTVFLCGLAEKDIAHCLDVSIATPRADCTEYVKWLDHYPYEGAWSDEDHDNKEWGGLEPTESMMSYDLGIKDDSGSDMYLYDDYGTEKSIFDPCPYGWRVGSGDLWLGFTKSGINTQYDPWDATVVDSDGSPYSFDNINFDPEYSCFLGMSMYLGDGWRTGQTSWFPHQGFRIPDGCGYRVGGCGNYVNANTASGAYDRVNIIHIHGNPQYFKQFETQLHYTVKSAGNPLRCVRDEY